MERMKALESCLTYDKFKFNIKKYISFKDIVSKQKVQYYNVPIAFDIETSSFYDIDNNKTAIMYCWQININGLEYLGRTWDEFINLCNYLSETYHLSSKFRRIVIYVHNLSHEFQYLQKMFIWDDMLCLKSRTPIYAVTSTGIEFRCSYLLSGVKLANLNVSNNLKKAMGDLDYRLKRHSKTPLTNREVNYALMDVRVLSTYIDDKIKQDGGIHKIPYTKTGYVRRYVREWCSKDKTYYDNMRNLTLDVDEYKMLKQCYQGGFTHANPLHSDEVMENVSSYDFTSSYPSVMLSEKFPMSKGRRIAIKSENELSYYIKNYCCMFLLNIKNVDSVKFFDNPISKSKCVKIINDITNNGRVVSADELSIVVTETDFKTIIEYYTFTEYTISNFTIYKKGYLPKPIIESVLKLYVDKTELKGVSDKELEYMLAKENLNSVYGMTVTDIIRDIFSYDNENLKWDDKEKPNLEAEIINYNNDKKRFLFYPWGVWITSYARRNLFSGITEFGQDYIYSDTDSLKVLNIKKHENYIKKYNDNIIDKIQSCLKFYDIDKNKCIPKNKNDIDKPLGVWDFEGTYKKFKTLGAKRYMYLDKDNVYHITVSGLNKTLAVDYISNQDEPFDLFTDNMMIPKEYSGRLTHTYIDDYRRGVLTDYMGNKAKYNELSSVHFEESNFTLKMSELYVDYILGVKLKER